ncbi:MAG TPA: 1-acyl-sn-glycerol-3-phosphate acyltransferase [Micropepsaceae bacterium]|nr:1-acyl-sn-glycerol-3-phosphate acyltransferase [Micropepsaceae bacterium]
MSSVRAFGILVVFASVTFLLLPVQWLAVKLGLPLRRSLPHRYHRFVCALFGIRIELRGNAARGGALIVANHTGWLDIPIFSAVRPVSFVSKAEVDKWPFFGTLARMQRSVFVRRERSQTVANRETIRQRLAEGDALVIFPEGTSSDGNRVLAFRSGLLSAAEVTIGPVHSNPVCVPVQPVSVAYTRVHGIPMGRENRPFFAWYGDMELVPHLWEALKTGPIDVVVEFHPVTTLDKVRGRKNLAAYCEVCVRRGLLSALTGRDINSAGETDGNGAASAVVPSEAETEKAA